MDLLDSVDESFKKVKKAEHKLLYYFIYSMTLGLLLLGGFGLIKLGYIDDRTLLDTYWGLVWLVMLFVVNVIFYWKILTASFWAILWVVFAFFCSFWVTGFLVDGYFDIGRDEPILAGTVAYCSHWGVTLLVAGVHYLSRIVNTEVAKK